MLKRVFQFTGVMLLCLLVFFGSSYYYLSYQRDRNARAGADAEKVPYATELPDSAGLLIELPEGDGLFFYLDFSNRRVVVLFTGTDGRADVKRYGYFTDYTLKTDYSLISGFLDRIGGLELDFGEGLLRYTGVQIVELVSDKTDLTLLRRQIVTALLSRISDVGITRQDLIYLIENGETNLTVPQCFEWPEHLGSMCRSAQLLLVVE